MFIPIFLALYPIAFYLIGSWLDEKLGTEWLKIVFLVLGLFSAGRQVYFLIKGIIRDQGE